MRIEAVRHGSNTYGEKVFVREGMCLGRGEYGIVRVG